ncbi:hypothetical protein FKM82_002351 [Ascaphus truei]
MLMGGDGYPLPYRSWIVTCSRLAQKVTMYKIHPKGLPRARKVGLLHWALKGLKLEMLNLAKCVIFANIGKSDFLKVHTEFAK